MLDVPDGDTEDDNDEIDASGIDDAKEPDMHVELTDLIDTSQ